MGVKKRTYDDVLADLNKAKAKLKDVQERGNEAISEYDLSFGYDADFYLNRCPLLANHVRYFENELKQFEAKQLTLF